MDQDRPRRKPAVRFTAARRAAALRVFGETGNKAAAAEAAGVDPTTITLWLKKDADFAAAWAAAAEAVGRRLAGARSPSDGVGDGRFETIQRTPAGRLQIRAVRPGKWNKAVEDRFFAALRTCGNVAACARLAGFSETAIWARRDRWPAFAERMEQALEEAEVALEFRLATLGSNVGAGMDEDSDAGDDMPDCRGAEARRNDENIPFDPEFALKYLKWREEKRRGRGRDRGAAVPRRVTEAELTASLEQKLGVLRKRHLAQGWSEDESGQLIPPGWVRVAAAPTKGSATEGEEPGRKGRGIPDRVRDDDTGGPG